MAEDTDLGGPPPGMVGGTINNKPLVFQDTGGILPHFDAFCQPGPVKLNAVDLSQPPDHVFAEGRVRFRKQGNSNHDLVKLMDQQSEPMDCHEPVVNLKRSKKVLEPLASPPVRLSNGSFKRKASFIEDGDFNFKSGTHGNPGLVKQVEELVCQINQTADSGPCAKVTDPQGIVFDSKFFSGNFKPKTCEQIGTGSSGQVIKFKDERTEKILTMKTIKLRGSRGLKLHLNEVKVPLTIDSPSVAKVFGLGYDLDTAYIVMENAGMNLRECIHQRVPREYLARPQAVETVALDILTALTQLAGRDIVHGDLKPENVCVDIAKDRPGHLLAKVIDMASCRGPHDASNRARDFTPEYLDPAFNSCFIKGIQPNLSPADDVWASGLILLFLAWKGHPMILHHAGVPEYGAMDPAKQTEVRQSVIRKIAQMREVPDKFLQYPDRPSLDSVLKGALVLDKDQRSRAKDLHDLLTAVINPQQRKRIRVAEPATAPIKQRGSVKEMHQQGAQIIKMKEATLNVPRLIEEEEELDYTSVMVDKKLQKSQASQTGKMRDGSMSHEIMKGIHGLDLRASKVAPGPVETPARQAAPLWGGQPQDHMLGAVKVRARSPPLQQQHSMAALRQDSDEMTVDLHSSSKPDEETESLTRELMLMDERSRAIPRTQVAQPGGRNTAKMLIMHNFRTKASEPDHQTGVFQFGASSSQHRGNFTFRRVQQCTEPVAPQAAPPPGQSRLPDFDALFMHGVFSKPE